jgi:hypothetical protein
MTCREFVEGLLFQNRDLLARAEAVRPRLDELAWNLAPKDGWSPAQIFEHLTLANGPYLEKIEAGIARAGSGGDGPIKTTWIGRLIYKFSGPSGNAPPAKVMVPGPGPYDNGPFERWRAQQERILAILDQSQNKAIASVKLKNPFLPLFGMTLCDFLGIWTTHTQRHVGQIEERVE